jgi:hypothetical protein
MPLTVFIMSILLKKSEIGPSTAPRITVLWEEEGFRDEEQGDE